MEFVVELLANLLLMALEFLLTAIGEAFFSSLSRLFRWMRGSDAHPLAGAVFYGACGALAGAVSLVFLPNGFMPGAEWRLAGLLLVPVAVALFMPILGRWLESKGLPPTPLHRFGNAYSLAFGLNLVRYIWAA